MLDFSLVYHTGELKVLLRRHISPQRKVLSVDDNFELNGAITKGAKLVLIRRDDAFTLDFK